MNVENNLLPVLYTFWLCEARPEWTDTCRLFLLEGQRKSFEYIKNSRDKGAYECMQRFTSYIMNSYIELDGGIPFRHYYEKFARSLFNEEFDLIRLPRCGNRFRRTRLQLQQKFCRYARRSPLQRRPYVQPGSRTALCFQDFLPSSHQQNNTLMRITWLLYLSAWPNQKHSAWCKHILMLVFTLLIFMWTLFSKKNYFLLFYVHYSSFYYWTFCWRR